MSGRKRLQPRENQVEAIAVSGQRRCAPFGFRRAGTCFRVHSPPSTGTAALAGRGSGGQRWSQEGPYCSETPEQSGILKAKTEKG